MVLLKLRGRLIADVRLYHLHKLLSSPFELVVDHHVVVALGGLQLACRVGEAQCDLLLRIRGAAAQALLDQGVQRVFLSLGGDGVFAAQQGETHLEPICKAEMRNATGAGDAMMASLVWSFLAGRDLAESCAAGTAAAAIAVESEETINPSMSAEAVLARAAK